MNDNKKSSIASLQSKPISTLLFVAAFLIVSEMLFIPTAHATAAFARQTGEPCSACHSQAYGPFLNKYGRTFKLNGFVAGHAAKLPDLLNAFSTQVIGSFTNTNKGQPGGAGSGFSANNNATNDWDALYYTGRVWDKVGAYLQLNFNPQVNKNISLAMGEIRFADHTQAFGSNLIYGASFNDGPTMSDVWMTTPEWMYPYNSSQLAPAPAAQTLMMQLMGFTAGSSLYANWDDHIHVEVGAYTSMAKNMANGLGVYSPTNPLIEGGAPYWRLWFQNDWGPHTLMVGGYGMQANIYPQGVKEFGYNSVTDWNADTNYTYMNGDHMFMLMGRFTRDNWNFAALSDAQGLLVKGAELSGAHGERISGSQAHELATSPKQNLNNLMVMGMYTFHQTYTMTLSYNHIGGSNDPLLYSPAPISGSRNGSPDSDYFQVQFDYIPFGKGESALDPYMNLRLSLQYTAYTQFNGASNNYDGYGRNASDNNTLYLVGNLMIW
jgi:hypothetical protein